MKIKYPRTRKRSGSAKCPHCGGIYSSMGMGTHIREAHKMVYETTATPVATPVVKSTATPVATSTAIPVVKTTTATPIKVVQDLTDITGKDLTECKRPDPVMQVDLKDFERIVSVWTKEAEMMRSLSPDKCTVFITGTMKDSVDIYRRKDCPMEKRPWGGLWVCECSLPITHENYRSECKYYSR